MTIAVSLELGQAEPPLERSRSAAAAMARIEVFDDIRAAEAPWRWLERQKALATPYQRYDFLAAWQHNVGARQGVVPCIVVGLATDGEPLFLWPFGRRCVGPVTIAGFLGSKHASFNLALWRADAMTAIGERGICGALTRLGAEREPIDLMVLLNQPRDWAGVRNPFAFLPQQASAEDGTFLPIGQGTGLSRRMQARLREKERKLSKLAGYRYLRAASAADIDRLLDEFFSLKALHMAAQRLPNVFAEPGVPEFLREACHVRLPSGGALIELHALEGDGEVLALFGAIADEHRFSAMFNTYTRSRNSRHSPGLILLRHMLAGCVDRGIAGFDVGVGRAHYKSFFCKEPEPLFDAFLPLTARGHLAAPMFRLTYAGKRMIKGRPALWAAVQHLRRLCSR
jgi:CelD/BcsL family acetyltransferase involved in cellulose biosynthesis